MPIVVILLGLAVGTQIEGGTMGHVFWVVVEEIGIGLIVGLALTWLTILMLRFSERHGWIGEHRVEIPIVALAAACFAAAQAAGGSGFIACFVGGLLLSGLGERHTWSQGFRHSSLSFAEAQKEACNQGRLAPLLFATLRGPSPLPGDIWDPDGPELSGVPASGGADK